MSDEPAQLAPGPETSVRESLGDLVLALVPGVLIIVVTLALYTHAAERQLATIDAACESETGRVQLELLNELDVRAGALERLAAARADGGEAWREEAEALLQGGLRARAVILADSMLLPVTSLPSESRMLSALDPRDDETRAAALRIATVTRGREAVTVSTAPLASGGRQLLVCAPVVHAGRRTGWVVGVFRLRDLLDAGLSRTLKAGFSAGVHEGPTLLLGARRDQGGPGVRFAHDAAVLRGPLLWMLEVWPAEDLERKLRSWGPISLLAAGTLLAGFVALSIVVSRRRPGS